MTDELLSLEQLSEELSIPESSIRYYVDRFGEYIPSVDDGDQVRYRDESLEVLAAVHGALSEDRRPSEIEKELATRFAKTVSVKESSDDVAPEAALYLSELPRQMASLMLPIMAYQGQVMSRVADALDKLFPGTRRLRHYKRPLTPWSGWPRRPMSPER